MSTTIDVICYKSKVLKNNEHLLMLRVTKDRKRRYLSLGISINPEYWDFTKSKLKGNCPNKEQISTLISEKTKEYREQIIDYKATNKEFTAKSLIEKVHNSVINKTVKEVFEYQIERLFKKTAWLCFVTSASIKFITRV